jgi:hypothetical protein
MRTTTYVSPKQQQHADGRDERQQQVNEILAAMSTAPKRRKPAPRYVFNVCLQRWVELR